MPHPSLARDAGRRRMPRETERPLSTRLRPLGPSVLATACRTSMPLGGVAARGAALRPIQSPNAEAWVAANRMSATRPLSSGARDVVRASPLAPYREAFERYLEDRRYATSTAASYLGSLAHLAHWMEQEHLTVEQLDEAVFARFLDEHLPQCRCPDPVIRGHEALRATCGHLLAVLCADGSAISSPR